MAILVTALLAQGLAACVPKPKPTPVPSGPSPEGEFKGVMITFGCLDFDLSYYEALAQDFSQSHPDIRVQVKSYLDTSSSAPRPPIRQVASGVDTFIYPNRAVFEDFGQGSLLDLTPLIEKDPSFDIDEVFPQLVDLFRWREKLFGLPACSIPKVIYYNKDLFDEARVEYPKIGWSWDDFLAKAIKLTKGEGEGKQYGFSPMNPGFEALVYAHGGSLADDSVDPPIPTLDNPLVVEATQRYADLALKYGVMPNLEEVDLVALARGDRIAMWTDFASLWGNIRARFNVGVVPFPEDEIAANPYSSDGCFISAGTAHPQECWEWIKYLSRQPPPSFWSDLPIRRSEAMDPAYRRRVGEEAASAFLYALENGVPPSARFYLRYYRSAVMEAMKGEKGVEEVLSKAQEDAMGLAEELRGRLASAPEPFAVATPAPEGEGVSITFAAFGLGTSMALFPYKELGQAFNELHPDVEVKVEQMKTFEGRLRLDKIAAGADCFLWPGYILPVEDRQQVLNLQPLLEADVDFSLDDFYPIALEAWQWEGDLWGLPAHIRPTVVFYNKDLFDEAGVEYPKAGWSWDDFLAKAIQLTKGEGEDKRYGFVAMGGGEAGDAIPFIYANGGSLVDHPRERTSPTLDDSLVVEGVRRWFDLAFKHGVMPLFPSRGPDDPLPWERREALVKSGKAAMWTGCIDWGGWLLKDLRPKMGMAPMPIGKEKATSFAVYAYLISRDTKHPKECWEWIKYLSKQIPESHLPVRRSIMGSADFREKAGDEFVEVGLASLSYEDGGLYPLSNRIPWVWQVRQLFTWTLEGIAQGADVGAALSEAQRRAESYLSCLESHGELSWEEREEVCRGELALPPPLR